MIFNKKLNIGDCPHVLRIKKDGELIAIILLDNLACTFIIPIEEKENKKWKE